MIQSRGGNLATVFQKIRDAADQGESKVIVEFTHDLENELLRDLGFDIEPDREKHIISW